MKKVAIITNNINCERHTNSSLKVKLFFEKNGWQVIENFNCDYVIIEGCGFHNHMYEKVRSIIRKVNEAGISNDKIIIMDCITKTHEKLLSEFKDIHICQTGNENLDKLINANIPLASIMDINQMSMNESTILDPDCFYIKVAEGCLCRCTFCVIKKAKGYIKSVDKSIILEQYKNAIVHENRKIFLMGEDTFAYGVDRDENIIDLIDDMLSIDSNVELYFGSLHCGWIQKYADGLLELCRADVVKKINIGLQHVNGEILERMGRGVDFTKVYDVINNIKRINPNIYLSADIIVGFPGETEEQFTELVDFVKNDTCFNMFSHYGYSDVEGAQSNNFDNKISQSEIGMRWSYLNKAMKERSGYSITFSNDQRLIKEQDCYFVV